MHVCIMSTKSGLINHWLYMLCLLYLKMICLHSWNHKNLSFPWIYDMLNFFLSFCVWRLYPVTTRRPAVRWILKGLKEHSTLFKKIGLFYNSPRVKQLIFSDPFSRSPGLAIALLARPPFLRVSQSICTICMLSRKHKQCLIHRLRSCVHFSLNVNNADYVKCILRYSPKWRKM